MAILILLSDGGVPFPCDGLHVRANSIIDHLFAYCVKLIDPWEGGHSYRKFILAVWSIAGLDRNAIHPRA